MNCVSMVFTGGTDTLEEVAYFLDLVLVARCPRGSTDDVYGYHGAGRNLHRTGVMFARCLNGQQARIKLMLSLARNA